MIGADFGVLAFDHHVLQIAEHFLALVVREAAAYATQYMEGPFLSKHCHEQVVEQARPVTRRLGESDDGHIQIMSRLDFETTRHIAPADNSFSAFFLHPLFVKLSNCGG